MLWLRTNFLLCLLSLTACGYVSVFLGKDLSWDLANYHYYNAYAFLNQRYELDYWPPSFIQAFFTPTLDLLAFYLINHFSSFTTTYLMGLIHGFNFWLIFAICYQALRSYQDIGHQKLKAFLLALAGLYGPTALPGIGSFQQDNTVSIFILAFILLQFKTLSLNLLFKRKQPQKTHQRENIRSCWLIFITANFLLGIAAGLKLTAGIFIGGNLLSLLLVTRPWLRNLKILAIATISAISGLMFASGYWMWFLWQKYHNPVFPFFNSIFHSPYYAFISWHDTRFLPSSWIQSIFFPFYFSWNHQTNELPFLDFRFAILYLALIIYCSLILMKKASLALSFRHRRTQECKMARGLYRYEDEKRSKNYCASYRLMPQFTSNNWEHKNSLRDFRPSQQNFLAEQWFFSFFIFSYLLWEYYFSVMRYLVTLEMLAPLAIYLIVIKIFKSHIARNISLAILLIFIFLSMSPAHTTRAPWYTGSYFNVALPSEIKKEETATVLLPYSAYALYLNPRPQSYLIPFFSKKWRFIGVPFRQRENEITPEIDILLSQNKRDKLYILSPANYLPLMLKIAQIKKHYSLLSCKIIGSDRQRVTSITVMLCQINKNLSH